MLDLWWRAYPSDGYGALSDRFVAEAATSLPGLQLIAASLSDDLAPIHMAMSLQRLRLQQDQRVPEWDGP